MGSSILMRPLVVVADLEVAELRWGVVGQLQALRRSVRHERSVRQRRFPRRVAEAFLTEFSLDLPRRHPRH